MDEPFSARVRRRRIYVGTVAVCAVVDGLIGFSWIMLSMYFVLLTDLEYQRITETVKNVGERAAIWWGRARPNSARVVVLYDGACGMCDRFISFVPARNTALKIAPMQGDVGRQMMALHGKDETRLETIYVAAGGRCLERADAILFILSVLDGVAWRVLGSVLRVVPMCVLNVIYDVVADNRYRIRGACDINDAKRYEHRILRADDAMKEE